MHIRPKCLSREKREQVLAELQELLRAREEVLVALLHGSFLEGGSFRDLDLALYVESGMFAGRSFRDYEMECSVRLELDLGLPVDVRVFNDAPVTFRYHSLKGAVLVMRDPELLDELRVRTWNEYCDFAPFARQYLREAIGG